jgi:phytoene synthase
MTPDEYCARKAAQSGSSFYYSFLFLDPERRRAITALYAFCREVDDVVDGVTSPDVAHAKLAWWRQEIAAAFAGTPQHPVARALQGVVRTFALPQPQLQTVLDGMAMDLERTRYVDFAELELYCYRVAGVVGVMSAEIFGTTAEATREYARELGIAFQLTNIIRDVGEDARRGRIYLPQDELARFGVSASAIFAGKRSDAFVALMRHQVARARERYANALALLPAQDRVAQRPGLIMAAIYRRLQDEIEASGFDVLDQRIALTPLTKFWIAWTTARAA